MRILVRPKRLRSLVAALTAATTGVAMSMAGTQPALAGVPAVPAVTFYCNGLPATIVSDSTGIFGTSGNDVIVTFDQNTSIWADTGNDTICAGGGNDYIWASWGNDTVFGEGGNDEIYGGPDSDAMYGGSGDDFISDNGLHFDPDFADGGPGTDRCTATIGLRTNCESDH